MKLLVVLGSWVLWLAGLALTSCRAHSRRDAGGVGLIGPSIARAARRTFFGG
jgi:hypothetical protein